MRWGGFKTSGFGMPKIRYLDRKQLIRTELLKAAFSGKPITYSTLSKVAGMPVQGPWKVLDVISNEEVSAGYPDVTWMVRRQMDIPDKSGSCRPRASRRQGKSPKPKRAQKRLSISIALGPSTHIRPYLSWPTGVWAIQVK
jgi:hypothetical protein